MGKRARIHALDAARPPARGEGARPRGCVERSVLPGFASGDLVVPVAATFPLDDVADGLRALPGRRQARQDRAAALGVRLVAGLVELDGLGAVHAAEVGPAGLQRELDLPLRQLRPALLAALPDRLERVLLEVHGVSVKRLTRRMSD